MPTPVSVARQFLTDEAVRALDDAVTVARRRSHSQTTSLHAVSALLSLPTSTLRDACARARSSAYSPRLQFRALELCVSVSLDRLPSSNNKTLDDEPPVSNSLMAAIRRSQANQRRHPETFHLYQLHQQLQSSQTSVSCVKVELKHFILSILDDPIVSRVFGDAGFRSPDIKLAILHPPPASRFQKSMRIPPLFLCNLPGSDSNRSGFNFPFAVDNGEEDFKRIGHVLAKKSSRNPLLIGVSAENALAGFTDSLKMGKGSFLPTEIEGLNMMCIKKEISEFIMGNLTESLMSLKLKEVRDKVESCRNGGAIVNFGELKVFLDGGSTGAVEFVVSQMSNLVQVCGGKLWLIGAVGSYDTYMKITAKFPLLEKDLDLSLIPITSSKTMTGGSPLKSSLMGSFVPLGGFFPVPNELENSSTSTNQSVNRCDLCNEKYEHEVSVVVKEGRTLSVADQHSTSLPSWLQTPESDRSKGINRLEAEDHGGVLNSRVVGLQRKWNDICQRLHQGQTIQQNSSQIRARVSFPELFHSNAKDSNQYDNRCKNLSPSIQEDLQNAESPRIQHEQVVDFFATKKHTNTSSNSSNPIAKSCEKDFKQLYKALADKVKDQDDAICAISQTISRCRSGIERNYGSNHRGDVWLMFLGPDRISKKKIATALAATLFGSKESLISVDLNFENRVCHPNSIFNRKGVNFSDPSFRGKTIIDYVAEELRQKPHSIVLLEHIDKADFLTQGSLSRAIKTGKLSDTNGREFSIKNAIFLTTSSCTKNGENVSDLRGYSEERVLNAKALQMQISVESDTLSNSSSILLMPKKSNSKYPISLNKRKLLETSDFEIIIAPEIKKSKSCFDLNLPVEEAESSDSESFSETKEWFEEFLEQVDERVIFKPFDFDLFAEKILSEISLCFKNSFGSNLLLEIDNEIMVQILASYWLSDRKGAVEDWIDTVLCKGFMEAKAKQCVFDQSLVKLVAVEGIMAEEHASCIGLPGKIILK